jgi:glucokinase
MTARLLSTTTPTSAPSTKPAEEQEQNITISTGIGTGVTVNGRIDPALADSEGGQMHFRHEGKLSRWEHFASGKAFFKRYGKFGSEVEDPTIWDKWSADVSLGIGSLIAVIQPEVVVIGGSMGVHLHKYHDHLKKHLEETRSPLIVSPPLIAAQDPDNAVINGCYVLARDQVA